MKEIKQLKKSIIQKINKLKIEYQEILKTACLISESDDIYGEVARLKALEKIEKIITKEFNKTLNENEKISKYIFSYPCYKPKSTIVYNNQNIEII